MPDAQHLDETNGYDFCVRYLSRNIGQVAPNLTNAEAIDILNAGLALTAVQHVSNPGWAPTADLGTTYGANAALNAASVGLPGGINIWCDLEGVASNTPSATVIQYCHAWYTAVFNAGYIPGLYVGYNTCLTATQLYDLPFQHYWRSNSKVPDIPTRGYQLVQNSQTVDNTTGLQIDPDKTQNDNLGGAVLWLSA